MRTDRRRPDKGASDKRAEVGLGCAALCGLELDSNHTAWTTAGRRVGSQE